MTDNRRVTRMFERLGYKGNGDTTRGEFNIGRIFIVPVIFLLTACASPAARNSSPDSEFLNPLGTPQLRFWDAFPGHTSNYYINDEFDLLLANKQEGEPINHLALSGGGINGALSAGILNAWTERGDRPEFDIVSGVSTGALVSVFAYLGHEYDAELRYYYTETPPEEMFRRNSIFRTISQNSLVDTAGFEGKVRSVINDQMLRDLAKERERGRILLIGTTNLDNEKMAIWDIGNIAKVGTHEAKALIQDVIIASSSIPGAFPAKLIQIEDGVERYDELHVDGGVSRQVFLIPQWLRHQLEYTPRERTIYLIRNGELKPRFRNVENDLADISSSSISTLIRNQGVGDVEYIYHHAAEHQLNFMLAYIDEDFERKVPESEYLRYMQSLYQYGYQKTLDGELWVDIPPSIGE
ncbi:patatin-like phospholipase family protein [Photobacterium makurazakiensis]|uniref:patatin-like phospholipase family protein n=1 Tax=Photobacterium makurazakiensis TaxID=2910234 RepID=UPI003D0D89AE